MKKSLLSLACVATLASCVSTGYNSMSGGLVSLNGGAAIYGEGKIGSKMGKACAKNYLGLYSNGDASIVAAAKNGGITNITTIDSMFKSYVVYGETCTVVRGE
jgi:hypothetical protein